MHQSTGPMVVGGRPRIFISTLLLLLAGGVCGNTSFAEDPCEIRVVDAENGWPVPLVQLTTTHSVTFVSDNDGVIVFDLPELMGQETWFTIKGHGYGVPKDGFGNQGVRLKPTTDGKLTVQLERRLPAKRLGRITGGGLFGESQRLGRFQDWKESGRLGCDSVQTAVHRGKLYWGWGDTTLPGYPLGLFQMTGATTSVQPIEKWEPPLSLKYELFRNTNGKPRNVAEVPGPGPTWLGGYLSVKDRTGQARLVASYTKIEPPLSAYETGLCLWDENQEKFLPHQVLWNRDRDGGNPPPMPDGHVVRWTDNQGKNWLLFGDPFPVLQCPDRFEAWENPEQWIQLQPQKTVKAKNSGIEIVPHRGSIAFNRYRNRWVGIFCQSGGESSALGEIWYCEADHPQGPWTDAIHVVTHDQYSFYNPLLHPEWVNADSPVLLFEATYTKMFSRTQTGTARHEYNQILYRLDLDKLVE